MPTGKSDLFILATKSVKAVPSAFAPRSLFDCAWCGYRAAARELINLMKRDYEAAVEVGRAVVQLNPPFSAAYKPYLAALGHLRRDQEAAAIRQRLLTLEPLFTIERFLANNPIERECDRTHYAEGLRLAGIPTDAHTAATPLGALRATLHAPGPDTWDSDDFGS
jgi:hypothetical protein